MSNEQHWSIAFTVKIGQAGPLVDAREKKPRQFRNMDSVVTTLRAIGFRAQVLTGR